MKMNIYGRLIGINAIYGLGQNIECVIRLDEYKLYGIFLFHSRSPPLLLDDCNLTSSLMCPLPAMKPSTATAIASLFVKITGDQADKLTPLLCACRSQSPFNTDISAFHQAPHKRLYDSDVTTDGFEWYPSLLYRLLDSNVVAIPKNQPFGLSFTGLSFEGDGFFHFLWLN